ncbi:MAG TPA: N-acetylmuramoyl-L-alanine amidase [Roseiarcus sp.]|nr:N-acetylmuramoyl-L-alanine amidase [Roseiarcus sp.]
MIHERRARDAMEALKRRAVRLIGVGFAVALALVGLTPLPAAATEQSAVPVAVAARLVEYAGGARLTFDLSAPVEGRAFALADPDRIVIDVPEVNFQIDPAVGRPQQGHAALGALIKSFRFGLLGPGKSRIVIDLNGPARVERLSTVAIAKGAQAARLQVDLGHCEPAVFMQTVKEAEQAPPAASAAPPNEAAAPAAGPPVIVLDPGHGGIDGGAYGAGVIEKTVVYDFSEELRQKLEAEHRYKVVMTRNGDEFVSLADRVRIAREANAALFISIHADSLPETADVSGATVYTLADRASDAEAARVAEHENAADKEAGLQQTPDDPGVADILFDLKRRESRTYAHMFSRGVVGEWRSAGRLNRNPERSAGFVVLKAPDFPSVLLELGYLSNRQDVKALTSPEWRAKATSALVAAIDHFFAAQTGPEPEAVAGAPAAPAIAHAPQADDKSGH